MIDMRSISNSNSKVECTHVRMRVAKVLGTADMQCMQKNYNYYYCYIHVLRRARQRSCSADQLVLKVHHVHTSLYVSELSAKMPKIAIIGNAAILSLTRTAADRAVHAS